MSSRSQSDVPEGEDGSKTDELEETEPQPSYDGWGKVLEPSDLKESYKTVIEIYESDPYLQSPAVESTGEEILIPDAEAYDDSGESLEALREKLDGDTLIVAFGFDGRDLPGYHELLDSHMNSEGNWWDRPDEVEADLLIDRETYSGAVNSPRYHSRHLLSDEGLNREVYLIGQD